ncbi:hypothetical protein P152DRAFT_129210 [Eremomyces bilateralis CBS 781.70]|uniref:CENP-V/GFA domain-containing protein n=1 Tax=Eremomyces bilateralis CBS 781.70 TaxID=1392243 RepID=A0A6G1GFD5_9PEZI|nr:uncharacterized protein P152DRAFT_129210 [Eremomyces bilateralis CBS 781.70]KAF1816589.1 hypothetical protein P152DRAFT_129210 [Eremomyces bilateralis CBS 781.70]
MAMTGKCHCGAVAYEAELPDDKKNHVLCHCNTCKVLSTGAFSLNQIIPKSVFKVTKGDLKTYTYKGDSGKGVDCLFCSACGTHIYHVQEALPAELIVLRTATLDDSKSFPVAVEVYGKDRYEWQKEVAHTFEVMPPAP